MKTILILGPFGNNGGRDFEAQFIASSLEGSYNVKILSTGDINTDYILLDFLKKTKIISLNKLLFQENLIFRIIAFIGYLKNGFKKKPEAYVNSRVTKKFLNFEVKRRDLLEREVKKSDLVLLIVQLSSKFVSETIDFCEKYHIPCLIRTTGTINNLKETISPSLERVTCFIHHSKQNAANLLKHLDHKFCIIDQCAMGEENLLKIPIQFEKPLKFGYLGRLSPEKQIEELLQNFESKINTLIIAGDGPLKESIQQFANSKNNINYIGFIERNNIDFFFKEIDVLIITSIEETGPLVGLEAMAAGKIVITTNVGAMSERLNNYTMPFLELDLSNLYYLMNLLNHYEISELEQIASLLRKKYMDSYSLKSIKGLYFDLINKILTENAIRCKS